MAVTSRERLGKSRIPWRRLMVTCPVTGWSVDTGYELSAISAMGRGPELLVDCIECGQDHWWRREDAFPG